MTEKKNSSTGPMDCVPADIISSLDKDKGLASKAEDACKNQQIQEDINNMTE